MDRWVSQFGPITRVNLMWAGLTRTPTYVLSTLPLTPFGDNVTVVKVFSYAPFGEGRTVLEPTSLDFRAKTSHHRREQ